ncbi:solute carrier family 35 member C2-like [Daphnia pulex]|uniref:solute carrier family 35 member C2-like n=1 Tax=Daphnia pulex TaxID=6669 RepID=UPI001EDD2A74|nr:solute carrier family 35 member C2-like [Daphnia pulex]XP_046440118.1 solute carrier family 35 member C2-like [Daphnia pulex]XP_046648804.1 solute carrier family 35 member C2-like [Daphnia pulicaria]
MPLSKSRLNTHSHHLSFSQVSNQSEQKRSVDGLVLSARNRSPSCASFSSQLSMESNPGKTTKVAKTSDTSIKQGFCKIIFRTLLLVLLYYLSSIGLTFYQKWLMRKLHYPLSIVITHLVVKFMLAAACRIVWEYWTNHKRPILAWQPYTVQLAPAGIASALDIGLSNWSLEFITVSLYTMSKSTAIIFIMGFALLFKLEKKHWTLLVVVVMISGGLVMFTYQATQFNLGGFLMVMFASFLSGLRWTLSQMVMQKSEMGLANPIDMMYHIQPWMIVTLLPFAMAFEGLSLAMTKDVFRFVDTYHLFIVLGEVLVGAVIAFFMELTEYLLVSYTSSLTLSVSGIIKEVLTLTLAVLITHDEMNPINAAGLVICLLGITLHVALKAVRIHNESKASSLAVFKTKHVGEEELLMNLMNSDSEEMAP